MSREFIEYKFSERRGGEIREFGPKDKVPMKKGKEIVLIGYFEHKNKKKEVIIAEHWYDYDDISKNSRELRKQGMLWRADCKVLSFILTPRISNPK